MSANDLFQRDRDTLRLLILADQGDLNPEEFLGAMRITHGLAQRSPQSQALGVLIRSVAAGELPVSALLAALDEQHPAPLADVGP